jgi:YD repeat-containing protein
MLSFDHSNVAKPVLDSSAPQTPGIATKHDDPAGILANVDAFNQDLQMSYDPSGNIIQTQVTDSSGSLRVDIIGKSDNATFNNAYIVIEVGGAATVSGTNDTVTVSGIPSFSLMVSNPTQIEVGANAIRVEATNGSLGTDYNFNALGQITSTTPGFIGFSLTGEFSTDSGVANTLQTSVDAAVPTDAATGAVTNPWLTELSVANLGSVPLGSEPFPSDGTGAVAGGLVIDAADIQVAFPTVNYDGVFNNSPSGIVSGNWRPGAADLSNPTQNLTDVVNGALGVMANQNPANPLYAVSLADASAASAYWTNIDPLVIDLSGAGIQLTSWLNNSVYFDTSVDRTTRLADGLLHHTSWVAPGTGILALDLSGDGKINDITETLSNYFLGGPTPGQYDNGLAALASLATSGATAFSASTSLTDPKTGKSYWSELVVWQDANQNGVSDPGELKTLDQLGITSISLNGASAEKLLNGGALTQSTSYTMSNGSTGAAGAMLEFR